MAKLVFGMNQSLDGYVDHMAFAPSPTLFRHFIEEAQGQAGSVYGRQMFEVIRYWDDDHPEWDVEERAFAAALRNQPKWVVSRSLKSVGPNARLVQDDLEGAIRELKAERDGEIEVAGPDLAQSLTELGLIDEYRIYDLGEEFFRWEFATAVGGSILGINPFDQRTWKPARSQRESASEPAADGRLLCAPGLYR
jgi:dihydrofolate reductase